VIDFEARVKALREAIGPTSTTDGEVLLAALQDVALAAGAAEREACAALCAQVRCRNWDSKECASQIRRRPETDPATVTGVGFKTDVRG